jgi:hypothetical protein
MGEAVTMQDITDIGGGLAWVGAEDTAGVLDEASFERDGRGEKQGCPGRKCCHRL